MKIGVVRVVSVVVAVVEVVVMVVVLRSGSSRGKSSCSCGVEVVSFVEAIRCRGDVDCVEVKVDSEVKVVRIVVV